MHPLIGDLTALSDKELSERLNKVMRVMRTSGAINGTVYNQAYMIYNSLLNEQNTRNQKILEEQIKRSGGTNFDDIINIG